MCFTNYPAADLSGGVRKAKVGQPTEEAATGSNNMPAYAVRVRRQPRMCMTSMRTVDVG